MSFYSSGAVGNFLKKLWLKPLMFVCYVLSPSYNNYRIWKDLWEEVKKAQRFD